jgi:hypothetical protein
MGDRRASMEDDEERALAAEIGDKELEEGVYDKGLMTMSVDTPGRLMVIETHLVEVSNGIDEEGRFE